MMCGRRPNSKNSKTVGNIFDVFRGFRFLLAGGIRRSIHFYSGIFKIEQRPSQTIMRYRSPQTMNCVRKECGKLIWLNELQVLNYITR